MADKKILTVVISPGPGRKRYEVDFGITIAQLVAGMNLFDRQIIIDGETISPEQYNDILVDDAIEIWASGHTKGA